MKELISRVKLRKTLCLEPNLEGAGLSRQAKKELVMAFTLCVVSDFTTKYFHLKLLDVLHVKSSIEPKM